MESYSPGRTEKKKIGKRKDIIRKIIEVMQETVNDIEIEMVLGIKDMEIEVIQVRRDMDTLVNTINGVTKKGKIGTTEDIIEKIIEMIQEAGNVMEFEKMLGIRDMEIQATQEIR